MSSHSHPEIKLKVRFKHVMTTFKVSFPVVMVHGQFNGICWHSSSISSQFGGLFSRFCGIYNVFKFDINIKIIKRTAVLGLNFQKFGCERLSPIQKLLEDR